MTDSDKARNLLIDELRDAVGDEALRESDLDMDRSIDSRPRSVRAAFESSRLLVLLIGGALLVAGVIAALATGSWIWFGVAIAAHALISVAVIATALAQTTQVEKPAPTTVTALEAEGVSDPERALNDLVAQVDEQREGSGDAERQRTEITPSSEPTRSA